LTLVETHPGASHYSALSAPRKIAGWLADATLAGLVVGAVEAVRIAGSGQVIWPAILACGLVLPVAILAGGPALAATWLVSRQRWAAAWLEALRRPGPARVRAIWRALLVALALALVFAAAYLLAIKTFGRFNAPGAVGLLHGAAAVAALVAIALGALTVDNFAGPRIASIDLLSRLTRGRIGIVALAVAVAAAIAGIGAVARAAAPAADFRPLAIAAVWAAALAAAGLFGAARRLPAAGLAAVLALAVALPAVALSQIGARDPARAAIAAHGVPSRLVLRALWAASDRDGDGFAGRFGGGDCDDSDPRVHPEADERIGNGRDDNCAGGDLSLAQVAHRAERQKTAYPNAPRRNVMLISIDAIRADHVGAYGYERDVTPHLDRLAASAARFDWAISASPSTRRAIPALMGARYASTFAFVEGGPKKVWPPRLERGYHWMVAESFAAAGYQTAAVLCCTTLFDRRMGVTIGIADVDASAARLRRKYHGDHLVKRFDAWLASRREPDRPFFMWVHFLDAHNPYEQLPGAPTFGSEPIDKYDSEIWYVDDKVGAMLAALERAGLADGTIVAVTSDHGDEFYEHGNRFHGRSLYNELVRVPLVIKSPGHPARQIAEPVSMVDIAPTLLDLVGIDQPAGLNGRSLAAAITGDGAAPDRMVLAELIADRNITRNLRAGFHDGYKIIWDLDANTYELYSLADDPADRRDLAAKQPEVLDRMRAELHRTVDLELSLLPSDRHFDEKRQRSR
jgi:arylsulfatase A-like enzyme